MFGSAGSAVAQTSYSFTPFTCDAGSDDTRAFGINDSNLIVGGCRSIGLPRGLHGFVYNGDSFATVEPPGSSNSRIRGVNLGNIMVGFYLRPEFDFFRGFMRVNEVLYRDIVPPGLPRIHSLSESTRSARLSVDMLATMATSMVSLTMATSTSPPLIAPAISTLK